MLPKCYWNTAHAVDHSPGWSSFQWAVYNRHIKVYELLKEADSMSKDPTGAQLASTNLSAKRATLERESIGFLKVTKAERSSRWPRRLWWALVELAESESKHPIGEAIKQAAECRLKAQNDYTSDGIILSFENISGMGVRAIIEICMPSTKSRYTVMIGQLPLLRAHGCNAPEDLEVDWTCDLDEDLKRTSRHHYGRTWVAIDGCITGALSLSLYS